MRAGLYSTILTVVGTPKSGVIRLTELMFSCSRNCASLCFAVSEAVDLFCFQILTGALRYHKRDELEGPYEEQNFTCAVVNQAAPADSFRQLHVGVPRDFITVTSMTLFIYFLGNMPCH